MTVQNVDVAYKVLGKNITALKGKNTQRNLNVVSRDQVNIPVGLIKLHKEAFLAWAICFVKRSHYS